MIKKSKHKVARPVKKAVFKKKQDKESHDKNAGGAGRVGSPKKTKIGRGETRVEKAPVSLINQEAAGLVKKALVDALFVEYVSKNIGSQANEILMILSKGPMKDEQLAETVSIKLNEVRRVLNLLNKHGIVRYDVKRDSSGWLSFEWHVDYVTFSDFYTILSRKVEAVPSSLPDDCNDFFFCESCNKKQSLIYPFDVAYEKSFKCNCGKNLGAITRTEAERYMRN